MAKVELKSSNIVTIQYREEKGDEHYGTCLWAIFHLDLDRYDLLITSDCGNYTYGWVPTPKSESFIELLCRMEPEYLLGKISDKTVVEQAATEKAILEYVKDLADTYDIELDEYDLGQIKEASHQRSERDVLDAVKDALLPTGLDGKTDDYEILCCIEKIEPAGARAIVKIFETYIQPKIRAAQPKAPTWYRVSEAPVKTVPPDGFIV